MYPAWINWSRFIGVIAIIGGTGGWFAPSHPGHTSWLEVLAASLFDMPFLLPWGRLPVRIARKLLTLHLLPLLVVTTMFVLAARSMLSDDNSQPISVWIVTSLICLVISAGTGFHWFVVNKMTMIAQQSSQPYH